MNKIVYLSITLIATSLWSNNLQADEPQIKSIQTEQLQLMGLDNLNPVNDTEGNHIRGRFFDINRSFSYQRFSYTSFGPGLEFGSFTSITSNNNQFPTIVHSFSFPR